MIKSEPNLFVSASTHVNSAKSLINECKQLISAIYSNYSPEISQLKHYIYNSGIDDIVDKVEKAKSSLMGMDEEFRNEYMLLLENKIETLAYINSEMSESTINKYSVEIDACTREYNEQILLMLAKYKKTGNLTPEMEQELEYRTALNIKYNLCDEMIGINPYSEEYIDYLDKLKECDKKIVKNTVQLSLQDQEKAIEEIEKNYNNAKESIKLFIKKQKEEEVKYEEKIKELEELYEIKNKNYDIVWTIERKIDEAIIAKKIELGLANYSELVYSDLPWIVKEMQYTSTFASSAWSGLISVGEDVADGAVMLFANGAYRNVGIDPNWAYDFTSIEFSSELYDYYVDTSYIHPIISNSAAHTAGKIGGTIAGYVGLSLAPGPGWVLDGLAAYGDASQSAISNGATFEEAVDTSYISALAGILQNKLGAGILKKANTPYGIVKNTIIGGSLAASKPVVTSISNYYIYANDMVDENGNYIYSDLWDYYVKSGGAKNTLIAATIGGIKTASNSILEYTTNQKNERIDQIAEIVGNVEFDQGESNDGLIQYIDEFNKSNNSEIFKDSFTEVYDLESVDSGFDIDIDNKAS